MKRQIPKQTILAVDDENHNLDILKRFLIKEYNLLTFNSGENALKTAFSGEPIDLILLDIMMPRIDGFEIAKQLKTNKLTRDIPIIFLTGQLDPENIRKGFELGCQDYITKPYHLLELKARVATHIKIKKQQQELEYINHQLEQMVAERTKKLRSTLDEKELLILELTHRVKNMLQMSISLLQLRLKNIEHPETKIAMRDFLCAIQIIALTHNLAQNEKDLMKIPMKEFYNQLIPLIRQRYARNNQMLRIKSDFDSVFLHINTVIPLGLLTIEVISSVLGLRPALPNPLEFEMYFKKGQNSDYLLEIKLSEFEITDAEAEVLSSKLTLAHLLASQLKGKLDQDLSKASFCLTFQEPQLKTYTPYVQDTETK
ncbi:response regulator [bacterium]|nr:response regulator [bacterium]